MSRLGAPAAGPELAWVEELEGVGATGASAFALRASGAVWDGSVGSLRLASVVVAALGLAVFFSIARFVVRDAAAVLAVSLLAATDPWRQAGTSVFPAIAGESLVLMGVLWALILQRRHREVELAGVSASRIGVAGVFLGAGLLLAPGSFATLFATVLAWLLLGLRRASSDATTLPVERPGEIAFFAMVGTAVLFGAALLAAGGVERLAGGSGRWVVPIVRQADPALWTDLYRDFLSPSALTDRILGAALVIIASIRLVEWRNGRQWQDGGLVPWVFLGLYVWALGRADSVSAASLAVPLNLPPLFVAGLAWLALRGLRAGRVRRQEYMFLLTWLLLAAASVPLIAGAPVPDPGFAARLAVLPVVVLVASRASRVLWETEETRLARTGILVFTFLPVIVPPLTTLTGAFAGSSWLRFASVSLEGNLSWVLLGAVGLGALSELIHVRPDEAPPPPRSGRRRFRRHPRGPKRRAGKRGGRSRRG